MSLQIMLPFQLPKPMGKNESIEIIRHIHKQIEVLHRSKFGGHVNGLLLRLATGHRGQSQPLQWCRILYFTKQLHAQARHLP